MSKLHKKSISFLEPGRTRALGKGRAQMEIAQIMEYQRIKEAQMQEAVKIFVIDVISDTQC